MPYVKFINGVSAGDIDHLLWTFGDGSTSTSTDATVKHYYNYPGDYTSNLQIWFLAGGNDSTSQIVHIPGRDGTYMATDFNNFYFSTDARTWNEVYGPSFVRSVFPDNGIFSGVEGSKTVASIDGSNWTLSSSLSLNGLEFIYGKEGLFITASFPPPF